MWEYDRSFEGLLERRSSAEMLKQPVCPLGLRVVSGTRMFLERSAVILSVSPLDVQEDSLERLLTVTVPLGPKPVAPPWLWRSSCSRSNLAESPRDWAREGGVELPLLTLFDGLFIRRLETESGDWRTCLV